MRKKAFCILALLIAMCLAIEIPLSAMATSAEPDIIDIDIYKAQCFAGIAYDPQSDAVEKCKEIYDYYIDEGIYSPTKTLLDMAYADEELMENFKWWTLYSLGAEPSSIVNVPLEQKDYYEALILAIMMHEILGDENQAEKIFMDATEYTTNIIDGICGVVGVNNRMELLEAYPRLAEMDAANVLHDTFRLNQGLGSCDIIDMVASLSETFIDAAERIAAYHMMEKFDAETKQWLENMYNNCDDDTDPTLKEALFNLMHSSHSATEAVLIDIRDSSFRLAHWGIDTTIGSMYTTIASTNIISATVLAGLTLGKTISDICFGASDVYEQFFLLGCVYKVQDLARKVAEDSRLNFINDQTNENAKAFIYSVDFYFESLIHTDIDCMKEFLNTLYNGGILTGKIKWIYGETADYQELVNSLEALRETRKNNYDLMVQYYKMALVINYTDTYLHYYTEEEVIPITEIYFSYLRDWGAPSVGAADLAVGEFVSAHVALTPSNTTQKAYYMTSDNPEVLQVKNGIMSAISPGTANVTVISVDNPQVSYTRQIKVGAVVEGGEVGTSTLRGTITSYGSSTDLVSMCIYANNPDEAFRTVTVKGSSFMITNLPSGVYKLSFSKKNHFTREYTVALDGGVTVVDAKLHLIGDVDGNGKVNVGDVSRINAHLRGTKRMTDAYILLCANVNGGKLNMGDVASLYAHIKGSRILY